MSHTTDKKVDEFKRKMRDEGSAGFAAGPWTDAEEIVLQGQTSRVNQKHTQGQGRRGTQGKHTGKRVPCTMGDRILTSLAIMALGMLIVGAVGAYFSAGQQHRASTTRTEPVVQRPLPATYTGDLQQLEARLMRTTDTHEKRLENIESRLMQAYDPQGERLEALENKLAHTLDQHNQRLWDLEQRLVPASDLHGKQLNNLEQRLRHTQDQYAMRMQDLEQKLAQTAAWLDELTAELTALRRDNQTTMAAATMRELPPAALPETAAGMSGDAITKPPPGRIPDVSPTALEAGADLPPWVPAATGGTVTESLAAEIPGDAPTPLEAGDETPAKQVAEAGDTVSVQPPAEIPDKDLTAAEPEGEAPDTQPADSADTVSVPPPAEIPDKNLTAAEPVAESPDSLTAGTEDKHSTDDAMIAWETPEKSAEEPAVATVESLSPEQPQQTAPELLSQPVKNPEARQDSGAQDGIVAAQEATGPWAINLASYTNEKIAARKLADFQRKGVAAEQMTASVRGRTVYRVCVPGFATRSAAEAQAVSIREQLGLKETWVMKR